MKKFNTAGTCRPNEHYMVDITERLEIIRKMIAQGDYFCINRGRQYGKTTTIDAEQLTWDKDGVQKAVNALLDCGESFCKSTTQRLPPVLLL